jgi:siroheme synthase-like protein
MEGSDRFFPLLWRMEGRKVLLVGGGRVAERKVRQLLDCNPRITIIAPKITEYIQNLVNEGRITWFNRSYQSPEAQDYHLVISATADAKTNHQVYLDAVSKNIPLNVVDRQDLCTVYFPAVIKRGDFMLALSSSGSAPFFTRALKQEIEKLIPRSLKKKLALAKCFRQLVLKENLNRSQKRILFDRFLKEVKTNLRCWSLKNPPLKIWRKWVDEIKNQKR